MIRRRKEIIEKQLKIDVDEVDCGEKYLQNKRGRKEKNEENEKEKPKRV